MGTVFQSVWSGLIWQTIPQKERSKICNFEQLFSVWSGLIYNQTRPSGTVCMGGQRLRPTPCKENPVPVRGLVSPIIPDHTTEAES